MNDIFWDDDNYETGREEDRWKWIQDGQGELESAE